MDYPNHKSTEVIKQKYEEGNRIKDYPSLDFYLDIYAPPYM